jgi:hypothetical protein
MAITKDQFAAACAASEEARLWRELKAAGLAERLAREAYNRLESASLLLAIDHKALIAAQDALTDAVRREDAAKDAYEEYVGSYEASQDGARASYGVALAGQPK